MSCVLARFLKVNSLSDDMIKAVVFDFLGTLYDPDLDELFPQTVEVLDLLHQAGLRLCLVSTQDGFDRQEELRSFGLEKFFEKVFVVPGKRLAHFQDCLDFFGLPACEVAVVGDHPFREIAFGKRLGCLTIWCRFRGSVLSLPVKAAGADQVISRLDELPDALGISTSQ